MPRLFRRLQNPLQPLLALAAAVNNGKHQFRLGRCSKTAFHAKAFDHVLRFADACGVDQPEHHPAEFHPFFHGVPGRPGDFGHDGAVISEQRIQKRAFPGIGQPDDCGRDAGIQGFAPLKGPQEQLQRLHPPAKRLFIVPDPEFLNILVRVVQHRVEVRADVLQNGVDRCRPPVNGSGELAGCIPDRFRTLCVDQVDHRFGGTQIHPPVQECPFGEFPRQGLPATQSEQFLQQGLQQHR